jgi:hypothetical protein
MRESVAAPEQTEEVAPRLPDSGAALGPAALLRLQRTAGNRAVAALIARTTFHPGVDHAHAPSGRWADVQAAPNSGWKENLVCSNMSPSGVVGVAIWKEFDDKPLALAHLNHYLSTGMGADFVEDANITRMLTSDTGVQRLLRSMLPATLPTTGKITDHVKIEQSDYSDQDLRFAFGAIDRLDFEADFDASTLKAWFQDRYEWHPVYPWYTAHPGDVARETNCIHAALVELKSGGVAADFWMKGEATVSLSVLPAAASGSGSGGTL